MRTLRNTLLQNLKVKYCFVEIWMMYPCYKQVVLVKKIFITLIKLNIKEEFEKYKTHITNPNEI